MKKYIHIQKADREFIAKAFNITDKSVMNAVSYDAKRGNTELAKRVRKLAIERGGIPMIVLPEWETLHDADGYMRLYHNGEVLLEVCKADNSCDVYHRGEKVKRFENIKLSDLDDIEAYATTLK